MEKVFRALNAKEKVFPFICCKFTIFASEYQASFPLVVAQKWELFSSQRFPCCRSRQTFVLQLFADFVVSGRISSFILCFFYNFFLRFCQGLLVDHFLACRKTLVNLTTSLSSSCSVLQYYSRFSILHMILKLLPVLLNRPLF